MNLYSPEINEVIPAWAHLTRELKPIVKDKLNPHYKSYYVSLDSVWDEIREPLESNGFTVIQQPIICEGKNCLMTTFFHTSGQWIRGMIELVNEKNNAQGLCAAITYMRRNSIVTMLNLMTEIDTDGNDACTKPPKKENKGESDPIEDFIKRRKVVPNTPIYDFIMEKSRTSGKPFKEIIGYAAKCKENEDKIMAAFAEAQVSKSPKV